MSFLKYLSAAFSQPKPEKLLLRTIRELQPRSIVELGIGDGERSSRIIATAAKYGEVKYCGIDPFELSPADTPHLSLKQAHRKLSSLPAQVRLLPGHVPSTLPRLANELIGTDLLIIAATQSAKSLQTVWSYAPRMLLETSQVLIESADESGWKVLTRAELPQVDVPRRKRSAA